MIRALQAPILLIASLSLVSILVSHTRAVAADKQRPQGTPILSGNNLDLVDIVESGYLYAATASDPYAYAAFVQLLVVIDISVAGNPERVGAVLLPSTCQDMALREDYLYAYSITAGVQIIDVSTPSQPTIVGSLAASGSLLDIDGDRLYLKNADKLSIYDLSNPVAPAHLGTSAFDIGFDFEAQNGYVYSAEGNPGMRIIDATNPATPSIAATLLTGSTTQDVDVAWPYAYAVNWVGTGRGLYVIDVTNPAAPNQVGYYASGAYPDVYESVAVNGTTVYVAGGVAPLVVFNVSNPAAPVKLQSSPTCVGEVDYTVERAGQLIFTESDYSLCVMDCATPTQPLPRAYYSALPPVGGLALSPTHLVMSTNEGGLITVDQSDTDQRAFYIGNRDEVGSVDIQVAGDYAYGLNCWGIGGTGDIAAFDISNPANPLPAGGDFWIGCGNLLGLGSNYGYAATFDKLIAINLSSPAAPDVIGQVNTPFLQSIAVSEPYIYGLSSSGLTVFDATNPAAPVAVGAGLSQAALGGSALRLGYENGHLFVVVSGATGGLRVVSVANPLLPAIVGSLPINSPASFGASIDVDGDHVYFSGTDGFVRVADVSDPANPIELGNLALGNINDLHIASPYAWAWGGYTIMKLYFDTSTDVGPAARAPLVLGQNYPNPFNPSTSIAFELPSVSHALVEIFDARGSRVRTLVDDTMNAGPHTVEWNGRDDHGGVVSSGVYFYRLTAGGRTQSKKMVVLK